MSIEDELKENVAKGKMQSFTPPLASIPVVRSLFLGKAVTDAFRQDYFMDEKIAYRFGQITADLERFVSGQRVTLGMDPYGKSKSAFMARLDPPDRGIWDFRLRDPKPALRVFGAFAAADVFIALNWHWRADLGGPKATAWKREIENTRDLWGALFPRFDPVTGTEATDYVTTNATIV